MKFSYNWLQSIIIKKLPNPKELADIITIRFFEVESVEKLKDDWIIDIDVLPNRAGDCLSHIGVAKEIAIILNSKIRKEALKLREVSRNAKDLVSVEVLDSLNCNRYTARVMINISVAESPKWIKERLESCGIQSINNVVDIANYVMLEMGQPLHIFDLDKLSNKEIVVRMSKAGEKITTLDNNSFVLNKNILLITDNKDPLAIAGIKGGKKAEIDLKTKNIVIESANFNRTSIRKASAQLKLRTDASLRFEHGLDPNMTNIAIDRTAQMIQEICSGQIAKGIIDIYPNKNKPKKIDLNLTKVQKVLGITIKADKIKKIINDLDLKIISSKKDNLLIEVPTIRQDITIAEDIIEEIGRILGYDKIKSELPSLPITLPIKNKDFFWKNEIKELLKSAGLTEVYNSSFLSQEQFETFKYVDLIEIEKPATIDQQYLKPSLIPNLIKNIEFNSKFFEEIEIFEIGSVFSKSREEEHFAVALKNKTFFDAKSILELVAGRMNLELSFKLTENNLFDNSAEVFLGSEKIGILGYNSNLSIFEVNFDKMKKLAVNKKQYCPIPKFPESSRDLAIIVPKEITYENIVNEIKKANIRLLEDISLFDIYSDDKLPKESKSMALRLIYRANRTLTSEEVNEMHSKIIKHIEKNNNWIVRK
ncbi:MAG TPA: phenylalanine--tRNA ligase subunit beta [Candidatus Pacearchaeota archaeon]|nr:phenylalanine--tRNA ligase subunit beta [Candidatus Pacearchaeota archaeon]